MVGVGLVVVSEGVETAFESETFEAVVYVTVVVVGWETLASVEVDAALDGARFGELRQGRTEWLSSTVVWEMSMAETDAAAATWRR